MTFGLPANARFAGAEVPVELGILGDDEVIVGAPEAGSTVLGELAGVEIGVWEMTPGTCRDTEADEYFVVLSGRATVDLGGPQPLEIRAGDVVRLAAGTKSTWTVHETLRKVYLTSAG